MKLFLVGGFLGSGKTTAIHQAVNYLHQKGKKAGVITNDQGTQQVDTQYIRSQNIPVEEVAGSCFCCNLPELDKHIQSLQAHQPDAIFAESVGSCTDLIATVVNPLLQAYGSQLEITLSIFADIQLLVAWLQDHGTIFHDNINYIYKKQLDEAEVLVVNKTDLFSDEQLTQAKQLIAQKYGDKTILYQNSLELESVSNWVRIIFEQSQDFTLRPSLELDYDTYGAGEAEMAWLDEEIGIQTKDKNAVSTGLLLIEMIYKKISGSGYPIGHLKFLLNDGHRQQKISYTSVRQPVVKEKHKPSKTDRVVMLVNARVQTEPTLLRKAISNAINELELLTGCKIVENKLSSFKAGDPRPSQRITS